MAEDTARRVTPAQVSDFAHSLGTAPEVVLYSAFAALLARLAGEDLVELCVFSRQRMLLTIPLEHESTFREVVAGAGAGICRPVAAASVEFSFGGYASADLAHDSIRLTAEMVSNRLQLTLASTTGLWPKAALLLWLGYFDHLLAAAVAGPDEAWKNLCLMETAEALAFYSDLNRTAVPMEPACFHELVKQQVKRTPGAIAIASTAKQFTYLELDQRSDGIAGCLRALGAGANRPVAVFLERTADLPVALLGVLKAGSCYVPLDIRDARSRIAAILDQCRPVAVISDDGASLPIEFRDIPVVTPGQWPDGRNDPLSTVSVSQEDRAYILFTSGTTGKPKGVPILHSSMVNLIRSMRQSPGFTAQDRLLAVSPISFDIASMELFLPLSVGGTVVLADRGVSADPVRLASMLEQFDITFLQATPVTWRLLVSSDWEGKPDLTMACGGEALPRDLANQLLPKGKELWNLYGPTETTIWSSRSKVEHGSGVVALGQPIANTTLYVLDEAGSLLPPGVPGELYIGGAGVSPGYLEPPSGIQRFVPDPFDASPGARMFRTGDMVRLLPGDQFEFLGRLDHQIKLRGFRIELGEVEFALRSFPAVNDAVASLLSDRGGEPHLVGFVTTLQEKVDLPKLSEHIAGLLPGYMLPARLVLMEAFPLTSSGKIDRKALAASGWSAVSAYRQPAGLEADGELEEKLLNIFRGVLNVPDFGVTDSFFDFGGYSLLTVRLFSRINRTLKLKLPVSLLFDAPTVRLLAASVDRADSLPALVKIRSRGTSAPLFVVHSYLLYEVFRQVAEPSRPVYGLRESVMAMPESGEESAATYVREMVKVHPSGPFFLTGWCAAASLTLEIARQLTQQNHRVGLVVLLDAERPGYRPAIRGKRFSILAAKVKFHGTRLRGSSVRQQLRYLGEFARRVLDSLLERVFVRHRRWVRRLEKVFGGLLPKSVFDNTWARIGAFQTDSLLPYSGKVMLFRAADDPGLWGQDQTMGWEAVVDGDVEVIFIPGDHETMFSKPNIKILSDQFRQALQSAEV